PRTRRIETGELEGVARPRRTMVEERQRADPSIWTGSPPGCRQANGEGAMAGPRRASDNSERPVRPRGTAKDRALRLLGVRDRSRRELERRLQQAGFEREEIDQALDALASVGLIDDERFAATVVDNAMTGRLSGRRAVMTG